MTVYGGGGGHQRDRENNATRLSQYLIVSQLVNTLKHCFSLQHSVVLSTSSPGSRVWHKEYNQGVKYELLRTAGQNQGAATCQGLHEDHLGSFLKI